MEQEKLLVHPYGEYYENVHHDLKKHSLEFMMEQLSHDTIYQCMSTISHPDKCSGKRLEAVLYWYEQIKQYTWLTLIGLLPVETLCLLQNAVENVIVLELKHQIDDKKNTHHHNSLTYMCYMELRNPTCCIQKSNSPDYRYKVVTDNSNVSVHVEDINRFVDEHDGKTVPEEKRISSLRSTKKCGLLSGSI
jgi:hypothetical protein